MDESKTVGIDFIERLSGGNHELFHSNLLAYLAEHDEEYFRALFKDAGLIPEYDSQFVGREKLKMDLTLWDKEHEHIVFALENKVKSFPNIKQLETYNEKIRKINKGDKDCLKVLLTLMISDRDRDEIEKRGWKVMTYEGLVSVMENSNISDKETYLGGFIKDYIKYVKNLVDIIVEAKKFVEDKTSTLSALYNLVRNINVKNENEKWRDALKSRAIYHHIKKRIEEDLNNERIKFVVTISHATPLVELQFYLTPGSQDILKEGKKEKVEKLEYYFIIFQDKNLLHGFRIWDKDATNHKKRDKLNKSDREKWLKEKWNKLMTQSEYGEKLNAEFKRQGIKTDLNGYPQITKNKEKCPAFVFDDSAMPHIVEELDSFLSIDLIIKKIEQEILIVEHIFKES